MTTASGSSAEYPQSEIERAYEYAGGESWDDLLQYLESDPSEDFEDLSGWTATASEGVTVAIVQDTGHTGMGMRIDFDLNCNIKPADPF